MPRFLAVYKYTTITKVWYFLCSPLSSQIIHVFDNKIMKYKYLIFLKPKKYLKCGKIFRFIQKYTFIVIMIVKVYALSYS